MNRFDRARFAIGAATAALLAGCGGGGSDAGDNTNYNARAAWTSFLSAGRGFTATGVGSDGLSYSLQFGTTPVGNASFPVTGLAANRLDVGWTLRTGGANVRSTTRQIYWDETAHVLGTSDNNALPRCSVATAADVPSTAARIGNAGALYTASEFDGCTNTSTKTGTTSATWTVELDAGIRYFCVNLTTSGLNGAVTSSESDCLEIDAAGTPGTHVRIGLSQGTFSLTARN